MDFAWSVAHPSTLNTGAPCKIIAWGYSMRMNGWNVNQTGGPITLKLIETLLQVENEYLSEYPCKSR